MESKNKIELSEKECLNNIKEILESNLSDKEKIMAIRRKCGAHHYKEYILLNRPKDQ